MNVFFDSSAWAKRYLEESGSDQTEEICLKSDTVILSILCVPEIISSFSRLKRDRKISEEQFLQLKDAFLLEIKDVQLVNITSAIVTESVEIIQCCSVRTLDALHIACAQAVDIDLFATADHRQLEAARALGLIVQKI